MNRQTERMHVKALMRLREQEVAIEKSLEYFFNSLKMNTDIVQNVIQECQYLSNRRDEMKSSLRIKISEIDSDFGTIRSIVNRLHHNENIDIDSCQQKMEELLAKIDQFNVESELEELVIQQKEIDSNLDKFKANLSNYGEMNLSASGCRSIPKNTEIDQNTDNYAGVKNFHSLIVKTGHTQNWKEEDHAYFLSVRKKCSSVSALVNEIQKKCPDLSTEQIVNHEAWYKIYLNLREAQRKSVEEWRKRKQLEKKEKIEVLKNIETGVIRSEREQNNENFCAQEKELSDETTPSQKKGAVSDERRKMIEQWKIHKENTKIADKERMKQQNDALDALKQKRFLMRASEVRNAVAEYKIQKNKIKSGLSSNPDRGNDEIIKSPALIKSLRKKDEEFLRKRRNLIETKYKKSLMNHCNIDVANHSHRPKDQSTLMKPTKIWEEKCRQVPSPKIPQSILYIKDLPKLALNNWRNQTSLSLV